MSKSADWSQYSAPQLRCIDALHRICPIHQTILKQRYKVRGPTLRSLVDAGLVRAAPLVERGFEQLTSMPFFTLTQQGLAVQRGWRRWTDSVADKLSAAMGVDAEMVKNSLQDSIQ